MSKKAFDVLPYQVNLDIHGVAGLQLRQVRDFPGLLDDRDFEILVREAGDSQTYPLNRHRTFEYKVTSNIPRISDSDRPRFTMIFNTGEAPTCVYVSLHDMAAQPCRWSD